MKFSTIISHSYELSRIIRKSMQTSDSIASDYFRAKKYIGSNERKMISEIVFSYLRTISLSDYFLKSFYPSVYKDETGSIEKMFISVAISVKFKPNPLILIDNFLAKINKEFICIDSELESAFSEIFTDSTLDFATFMDNISTFSSNLELNYNSQSVLEPDLYCMQQHIINSLTKIYSNSQLNKLAQSLLSAAPVCIRVNNSLINTDKAQAQLALSSVDTHKSHISPSGLILNQRTNLADNQLFKDGMIEIQDVGSQLISFALAPEPNTVILDACAGAGGKTLHIAQLTQNSSSIIATDLEYKRLKEILPRAAKAGITSIRTIHQKRPNELHLYTKQKFDYILIDAPCSGMGTVRRMPMPKWRLTQKLIQKLQSNQLEILKYYSKFLKINGKLVYATCSLLPEENEAVVNTFLKDNCQFSPEPLKPAFSQYAISIEDLKEDDFMLYLNPATHHSDGFFMAKIKRIED